MNLSNAKIRFKSEKKNKKAIPTVVEMAFSEGT
jgi:hypothetical protein